MRDVIIGFILGLIFWIICAIIATKSKNVLKECINIENISMSSLLNIALCICIIILFSTLFFGGLILTLSSMSISIFEISTIMFNALSPNALEFKDCLNAIVQITSILGTAIIASLAYVFKKKS